MLIEEINRTCLNEVYTFKVLLNSAKLFTSVKKVQNSGLADNVKFELETVIERKTD